MHRLQSEVTPPGMVFLRELKRRRVLHTASLYVVGAWIALQVVEVLSSVGLPASTMRNLLVALSAGFPVALVIGWFFDISREGIVRTRSAVEGEDLPELTFFDYLLMAGLVTAVVVDAWILSIPSAEDFPQTAAQPAALQRTLAVLSFEDMAHAGEVEGIGETFAEELRDSLARVAGLRVLGPETSKALALAGDSRIEMARELLVTALLLGEVLLDGDRLVIRTRLVGVPAGDELWSRNLEQPVGDGVEIQNGLVREVVLAVAPSLDPDPVRGPRAESGACSDVYDLYLRGKQLSKARRQSQARMYRRGMELLREAVAIDDNCALAWEAIAVGELEWTTPGFAKAGAAARRALELNDTLPSAWAVLAEIAEQDENWDQAEEYFLRALHADPANAHVNFMYGEALMVRGRHRDALQYVLKAYRYEPVSSTINFRVAMSAFYAGESDVVLERAEIAQDIDGSIHPWMWDLVAEAYLQKGEIERALESYARIADDLAPWFTDCVEARRKPELAQRVLPEVRETLQRYTSGQLTEKQGWDWGWNIIRCGIWLGEPDLVFGVLDADGVPPFESGVPTEMKFANMFHPDGAVMRRHPRFARMVVESGLLDYWKKWGWADMCAPEGEGFRCD